MKTLAPILLLLLVVSTSWGQLTPEQHTRLVKYSRWLGAQNICYNENWLPPNQSQSWTMDCSNTSRYLYETLFHIHLPRTASDQYVALEKAGRVHSVPLRWDGSIDTPALLNELRSGDLLFWENTYNVKRDPPVSHVMIYLGQTAEHVPMMFGSSSGAEGEHSHHGGVDVYVFRPNAPCGGTSAFFGFIPLERGKFIGFARPILQPIPPPPPQVALTPSLPHGNTTN